MYYLIYQITNKTNGMIYVGKHQTDNKNDDYMGSGKYLGYAIEKEGIENFEKTILFECQSEEEMNQKEAEIVNEEFVNRKDTYNVALGGDGGWHHVNSAFSKSKRSEYAKQCWKKSEYRNKISNSIKNYYKSLTEFEKTQIAIRSSKKLKDYYACHTPTFLGKHHTEETKQKISQASSKNQKGSKNSQYGKHWWKDPNNKTKSMSIKDGDPVPEGWIRGHWNCEHLKSKKTKYCQYCGAEKGKCLHLDICSRHHLIRGYKMIFHPTENIFGSNFYQILFSDIKKLYDWYFNQQLSIPQIAILLNYYKASYSSLYSCISNLLKLINTETTLRSFKEAGKITAKNRYNILSSK